MSESILRVEKLSKSFPGVKALNEVSFDLRKGEVHALLGENGAGKSTLMKLITGVYEPDSGKILFENKEHSSLDIKQAVELGISMVYQELDVVPQLSVAENIFLGRFPLKGKLIDYKEMTRKAQALLDKFDIKFDPKTLVGDLPIVYQQIVVIAKAISINAKVLILDEPTATLTNEEVEHFYQIVEKLKNENVSIIFISHRLDEIFHICDRVTVFRDGRYISTLNVENTTHDALIKLMVGRELNNLYPSVECEIGEELLRVENISNKKLNNVSLKVNCGEIVGIGGLMGSGRTEILRAIFGADEIEEGQVFVKGRKVKFKKTGDAIKNGIVLIPEDRKGQGLFLGLSVKNNILFSTVKKYTSSGLLNEKLMTKISNEMIHKLGIKTPSGNQIVKKLSGGNQQKVVISKCLLTEADVLLFDEPTRGIDVGARHEIYNLINELKSQGKAIVIVTSDMEELLGVSDRIYVICEGKVIGSLSGKEVNQEKTMQYASGISD